MQDTIMEYLGKVDWGLVIITVFLVSMSAVAMSGAWPYLWTWRRKRGR